MTSQIGGWFSLCRCCFIQYSRLNTFEALSHFLPGLAINSCRDQDPWRTVSSTPVASRPKRAGRALWKRLQDLQIVVGFGMPCCLDCFTYSHVFPYRNPIEEIAVQLHTLYWCIYLYICNSSSTAQGGGGSFKNRKPIGEVGCCESRMAKRIHWCTERCLRSPLCLSLSLTIYLPIYLLCIYPSI